MFELPSAKRVLRNELQSPVSSPRSSPDPEIIDLLRSRAHDEFTFTNTDAEDTGGAIEVAEDEDNTELVLFAAPPWSVPQPHKIRICSPELNDGEGGFITKRSPSYYFSNDIDSEKEAEYEAAAVSAETVLDMSKIPWPGCSLLWKVKTIAPDGIRKSVLAEHSKGLSVAEEQAHKRKRKGKKSRIAIRKKIKAREEKKAAEEQAKKEVGDAQREKRTRKNREKKVKKKEREKAKKLECAGSVEKTGLWELVVDLSTL